MEHHAYYIEGSLDLLPGLVTGVRQHERYDAHDPDFSEAVYDKFGIEEARQLQGRASLKSATGRGMFVIGISSITSEAQQALLKLFEEPQQGITFVLVVPHGALLPTLKSRCLPYPYDVEEPVRSRVEAKKFLSASGKDRSDFIAKLLKDEDFVKEKVRGFLYGLEVELEPNIADPKARAGLEDIQKVRSYVGDRSASLKMLLEHLAVCLPKS